MTRVSGRDSFERQIQPGHFLYWQDQHFRVLAGDLSEPLLIHVENIVTLEQHIIRVEELLLPQDNGPTEPIFAPTLEALQAEIDRRYPPTNPINATGLPAQLLHRADTIVAVVETVDKLVAAEEGRALLRQEKFQRTPAIRRACAQLAEPVSPATYYNYRRLYREWDGDRGRIAAALRRSTFNQTRMDKAQLHFVDTHILRFYARSRSIRPRPMTLYRIAQSTFERTKGLWLDPEQGAAGVPENVVEELLNPKLPMQAILDNPEKARLLRPIALPSRSWFYQYLRWFEHQPEQGKEVMIARHGREMWEREQLIFDTFVTRATLPLQYVFADHWLVDVFTVDEATRSRLDRLWLTLLIDAYSRSVLGLALLYEVPCIESIQSALRHAIWPKTSHQELGIEGEWLCYGIPQQLSLDNAWAHHSFSLENLARVIGQGGRYSSIDGLLAPLDLSPALQGPLRSPDRAPLRQPICPDERTLAGGDPLRRCQVPAPGSQRGLPALPGHLPHPPPDDRHLSAYAPSRTGRAHAPPKVGGGHAIRSPARAAADPGPGASLLADEPGDAGHQRQRGVRFWLTLQLA